MRAGHRHAERAQLVEDGDRPGVMGEDVREALVGERRLVGRAAAELDAAGGELALDLVDTRAQAIELVRLPR